MSGPKTSNCNQIIGIVLGVIMYISLTGCQKNLEINQSLPTAKVEINNTVFTLEKVSNYKERLTGLMNRKNLKAKTGMLFIFEQPQILSFWMKNTLIPLDIIFIDENLKIINIEPSVQACKITNPEQNNCPTYLSSSEAMYVIELNAGETDIFELKSGQTISLLK